jgi:cellulose synthase/poly-beta-1,6-N-acetylglucosamine synthase-like glycosyltransferase
MLMLNYTIAWLACPSIETKTGIELPSLSILIAARNEEQQISACLNSIIQSIPPSANIEIVIINDHSTDSTAQIVTDIAQKTDASFVQVRLLHLADYTLLNTKDIAYKKRAIEYGIAESTGQIIMTTDADCIVSTNWIVTILSQFIDQSIQAVASPVLFHREKGWLGHFQELDFYGMMGITAAGIYQGWQHMANGANLAYRRSAYMAVGGYHDTDHLASGDDMFLVQKIAKAYNRGIVFSKSRDSVVYTRPESTLPAFFAQRLRWATKSSAYQELPMKAALALVWLSCLSLLLVFGYGFFDLRYMRIALVLFCIKSLVDLPLLLLTTFFWRRSTLLLWFLPSAALHIIYVVWVGTASIFVKNYAWKGRLVR